MAIIATGGKLHWNYLLALDRDMEAVSRYIEFTTANENVYSIELAHLLFAAASEVDVVAKLVCEQVDPTARRANIDDYRSILASHLHTWQIRRFTCLGTGCRSDRGRIGRPVAILIGGGRTTT
jgi:hypothetical protein